MRIRYRIDGVLWEEKLLPKKVRLPLTSRFKIMSRLDITERRIPQDGRISLRVGDKTVDFRVSTMPSKYGEKVVVRILDKEAQVFGLDNLITGHCTTLALVRQYDRKTLRNHLRDRADRVGKDDDLIQRTRGVEQPESRIS